jgi:hypothetical protein
MGHACQRHNTINVGRLAPSSDRKAPLAVAGDVSRRRCAFHMWLGKLRRHQLMPYCTPRLSLPAYNPLPAAAPSLHHEKP